MKLLMTTGKECQFGFCKEEATFRYFDKEMMQIRAYCKEHANLVSGELGVVMSRINDEIYTTNIDKSCIDFVKSLVIKEEEG